MKAHSGMPGPKERELAQAGIVGPFFCTRCGERLDPEKMVWLELDQRSGTYHDSGEIPADQNQGGFTFGSACAKRQRKEHRAAIERAKDRP